MDNSASRKEIERISCSRKFHISTFPPLNKAGHAQPWPQSSHLLEASNLTRQGQPAKQNSCNSVQPFLFSFWKFQTLNKHLLLPLENCQFWWRFSRQCQSYILRNENYLSTWAASILSRWNWQIFPRAETALSYAITLSECSAFGCLITKSNLERASVKW